MLKRQYSLATGLVLLIVLVLLNLPEQPAARIKLALGGLFLPLFGIAGSVQQLTQQIGNTLVPRGTLLKQIEQLRQQLMQLQEAWRENAQLRQALGWQRRVPWALQPARVIGQDPANWWRTMLIDVGSRDR